MKKKKVAIILSVFCFAVAIGTYAAPQIMEKIEYATAEIVPGSLEVKHNRALRAIEKDMKKGEDVQADVEAYAHFLADLFPSEEEIRYVDELIGKGYRTRDVVEIFEFWQDTQEDISIIEKAFEYHPNADNVKFWVDEAFISLCKEGKTKGKYEGLSIEEVKEYRKAGMDYGDIAMADKLSRHGTKEIRGILSDKGANKSWFEIIDGVYNLSMEENRNEYIDKYKDITNPNEILASKKLAEKKGFSLHDLLDDVKEKRSSTVRLYTYASEKKNKVKEELTLQGIGEEAVKEENAQ